MLGSLKNACGIKGLGANEHPYYSVHPPQPEALATEVSYQGSLGLTGGLRLRSSKA